MAIAGDKFKSESLRFILKPLSWEDWEEMATWECAGLSILQEGKIGVRFWKRDKRGKLVPEEAKVQDIDKAIHMQENILETYRGKSFEGDLNEVDLAYLAQEIFRLASSLFLNWKKVNFNERKEVQKKLQDLVGFLKRCFNPQKLDIKDQAEKIAILEDSLKRKNPSALAARCVGAMNDILKRLQGIDSIVLKVSWRKNLLLDKKNNLEKQKLIIINILEHLLKMRLSNILGYMYGIDLVISFLNEANIKPFAPNSIKAKIILRETKTCYKVLNWEDLFTRISSALKLIKEI
jgi:hypothetical protein